MENRRELADTRQRRVHGLCSISCTLSKCRLFVTKNAQAVSTILSKTVASPEGVDEIANEKLRQFAAMPEKAMNI
jgi:hypothetical protein